MSRLIGLGGETATATATKTASRVAEIRISESASLGRELSHQWRVMLEAITQSGFYVQLLLVGAVLTLAWAMALLIARRLDQYFGQHPPHNLGVEMLKRCRPLYAPFLAIVYLGVLKPFADGFGSYSLASAFIELSLAYMLARIVRMTVHAKPVANLLAFLIIITAALKVTAFYDVTAGYLDAVAIDLVGFHISLLGFINGILILILVFWIAGIMSGSLEKFLRRTSSLSYSARELTAKFFRISVYFIALMVALSVLGVDLTAFAVFGGALGVGIGLGLQKITANFVSGITLLMEKSIKIGDVIEVAETVGSVRELNIRYALVETVDGREMLIPNEELVSTRITNWTYSNTEARITINIRVSYDADMHLVRRLLLEAATEHPKCLSKPAPNCFLREFADFSVNFILVFWIADINEGRFTPQSEVMMAILDKFRQNNIEIPYPQRVVRTIGEVQVND